MGWASGNEVFDPVAQALIDGGADDALKRAVCSALIGSLVDRGWDTEGESLGMFQDDAAIVAAFREHGVVIPCHAEHHDHPWPCEKERGHFDSHRAYVGNTWTDLDLLDGLIGAYVDITDPNGKGMAGVVVSVYPNGREVLNGVPGRLIVVDYGYEWFVTENTVVRVTENPEDTGGLDVECTTCPACGCPGSNLADNKPEGGMRWGHISRVRSVSIHH
ncbi:hypothetical protein [Streptomyces sp. 5-10]|uniref:hypothetical protein n=1 Tax=Streptomyces sp. 5-10 TaxID=878925 RepID=UPI00168BB19A|nr:hypothetical protein [Streptomyces sp. 5-10]MBD3004796.1 hypothetical protein [Streptomyces sp. 5-10]